MPIVSFSISETLRRFLRKLVSGGQYKNSSTVMREALSRMMDAYSSVDEITFHITDDDVLNTIDKNAGNVMIVVEKNNANIEKKLAKIEDEYKNSIKGKTCYYYKDYKTIIYLIEEYLHRFHLFVAELNEIEELKNIRYIIL
ncbi:MAG: ribbon-helix-helix domain-containing protein [Promethearchaeota archaeon]